MDRESRDSQNLVRYAADGLEVFLPQFSAKARGPRWQKWFWGAIALMFLMAGWLMPSMIQFFLIFAGIVCLSSALLRYVPIFITRPFEDSLLREEKIEEKLDDTYPIYTILVPLYDEAHMLPDLIGHLRRLNWPSDRLDIKIILEAADRATCEAADNLNLTAPFEIIIVPDYFPRTKAKACNYALFFARGEFVTIYDAEDQPDPDQLLCAWHIFRDAPRRLACLQAPLGFFNANENWLSRQFTIEYIMQFMFFMPFIIKMKLPVFLGGSSNHFRMEVLHELYGWDAYNVTEDADIGLRLARRGFECAMLPSLTQEEAACQWGNWFGQRSRWVKGWLQTWLVAMRSPSSLMKEIGMIGFIFLQLLVPAYIFALFVHLIIWPVVIILFFYAPESVYWIASVMLMSYSIIVFSARYAVRHVGHIVDRTLMHQCLFMPFYWLLMGLAACRALFQLIINPYYWDKTKHGVSQYLKNKV